MNKYSSILFLGLIRNIDCFYKNIKVAVNLRNQNIIKNIYCVIWESDARKHKNELRFLENNNIIFCIEKDIKDEPLLEGKGGSGMKVLYSIRKGLEMCNVEEKILKTRFDLVFTEQIIKSILLTDLSNRDKDKCLKTKLLVPGMHFSKPYFFLDWFYYSDCATLRKMVDLPIDKIRRSAKLFQKLNIKLEVGLGTWQFIGPFAECSPLVDAYMMICPFFINQKKSKRFRAHIKKSLVTKSFLTLIFNYFINVKKNIIIYPPKGISFFTRRSNFKQDNQFYYGRYKRNKPNFLIYKSNIFKYWPLPLRKTKDIFLYNESFLEKFPIKNNFLIFRNVNKDYEKKSLNIKLISDEFKADQTKIIESIYGIDKDEIYDCFWS